MIHHALTPVPQSGGGPGLRLRIPRPSLGSSRPAPVLLYYLLRYLILSKTTPETLPAPSLYCTNTVLVFPPARSLHLLVATNGCQAAEARVPERLEMRIKGTPERASLAESESVTMSFLVEARPPFMRTVPVGAALSTVMVLLAETFSLPAAS